MRIAAACANNLLFRNLDRDQRQEVVRGGPSLLLGTAAAPGVS